MHITRLRIAHYRNHTSVDWSPHPVLNCIVGSNGVGKTNLLDSIHQLCLAKSHLTAFEQETIQLGADFYRILGDIDLPDGKLQVVVKQQAGKRKVIEYDGSPLPGLTGHVGKLPVIIIAPDDTALIKEASAERRRFLDIALCQISMAYLKHVQVYNKVLEQRNAVLKSQGRPSDIEALVGVYDRQMAEPAYFIYEARKAFTAQIADAFSLIYQNLIAERETVSLQYSSVFDKSPDWLSVQKAAFSKDLALQRSTIGIHRDDVLFFMDGRPLKRFSSQGQLKSFVIALKLAQYEALGVSQKPVLLLDDIFDKLDTQRITNLLDYLTQNSFGQIFITDTDTKRALWIGQRLQIAIGHVMIDETGDLNVIS
jgi:DNA replication and repair protein RecF